jgi:transcriptional regulator with XRE-family HTH domain
MGKMRAPDQMERCEVVQRAFGQRLQAARRRQGLMQKTLAAQMGLTRANLSNIERGKQRIYLDQVLQVAHLLSVATADLLPDLDDIYPKSSISSPSDDPIAPDLQEEVSRVLRSVVEGHASTSRRVVTQAQSRSR